MATGLVIISFGVWSNTSLHQYQRHTGTSDVLGGFSHPLQGIPVLTVQSVHSRLQSFQLAFYSPSADVYKNLTHEFSLVLLFLTLLSWLEISDSQYSGHCSSILNAATLMSR